MSRPLSGRVIDAPFDAAGYVGFNAGAFARAVEAAGLLEDAGFLDAAGIFDDAGMFFDDAAGPSLEDARHWIPIHEAEHKSLQSRTDDAAWKRRAELINEIWKLQQIAAPVPPRQFAERALVWHKAEAKRVKNMARKVAIAAEIARLTREIPTLPAEFPPKKKSGGLLGGLKKAVSSVGKAVSSAAKSTVVPVVTAAARDVVKPVAKHVANTMTAPHQVALRVARGENVIGAVKATAKKVYKDAVDVLPIAASVVSLVPGLGTLPAGVLNAAAALAQGGTITDVAIAAARGAIPGGPAAAAAFDAGIALAKGGSLTDAALAAAKAGIPAGPAREAFDKAVGLGVAQAIQKAAKGDLKGAAATVARGALKEVGRGALGGVSDRVKKIIPTAPKIGPHLPQLARATKPALSSIPAPARAVANALRRRPELRSVPLRSLAPRLGVPLTDARKGLASLLGSMSRVAQGDARGLDVLRPEPHIEAALSPEDSYDAGAPRFASVAARPRLSPRRQTVASSRTGRKLSKRHVTRLLTLAPAAQRLGKVQLSHVLDAAGIWDAGAVDPFSQELQLYLAAFNRWKPGTIKPSDFGGKGKKDVDGQLGARSKQAAESYAKAVGITWGGADKFTLGRVLDHLTKRGIPEEIIDLVLIENGGSPGTAPPPPPKPAAGSLSRDEIRQAQLMLAAWGKEHGTRNPPDFGEKESDFDGIAGDRTKKMTTLFQKSVGLKVDGVIGPETFAALQAATAPKGGGPVIPPQPVPSGATYTVKAGEGLRGIAKRHTGAESRYVELLDPVNPGLKADSVIHPGQVLNLPASWVSAPVPELVIDPVEPPLPVVEPPPPVVEPPLPVVEPPPPPAAYPPPPAGMDTDVWARTWTTYPVGYTWTGANGYAYVKTGPHSWEGQSPGFGKTDPPAPPVVDPNAPPAGWLYPPAPKGMTDADWHRYWPTLPIGQIWEDSAGYQYQKTAQWGFYGPIIPQGKAPPVEPPPPLVDPEPVRPPPVDPNAPPAGWLYPPAPKGMTDADWHRYWPTLPIGQIWEDSAGYQYQKTAQWGFYGPIIPQGKAPPVEPPPPLVEPAKADSGTGILALLAVAALAMGNK